MMTSPLPDLSGLTILVVDDNEDALNVLETLLKACGATVLAARDAFAALGYLETSRVTIILSDLSMPRMDRIELIERIRKSADHHETPAIAISGFPESYRNAVAAGFNAFTRKPVEIDKVCQAVFDPGQQTSRLGCPSTRAREVLLRSTGAAGGAAGDACAPDCFKSASVLAYPRSVAMDAATTRATAPRPRRGAGGRRRRWRDLRRAESSK